MADKENPYGFSDDVDEDLWKQNQVGGANAGHANFSDHAEAAQLHVAAHDGEVCPGCGKVHTVPKGLSTLPRQLHGLTAKLLDGFEHGNIATVNAQNVPQSLRVMASMMNFTREVQNGSMDAPTVRAVAEILDEMTDGKVTAKVALYASERDLRSAHFTCKTINDFVEFVRSDPYGIFSRASSEDHFLAVIEHILGYHAAMRTAAVAAYREQCAIANVEVDNDLVEHGRYTKDTLGQRSRDTYFKNFFADTE